MTEDAAPTPDSGGLQPGSPAYRRLLVALFFIGVATFAQLYSPQGLLPLIAADQQVSADAAALMISAATLGLAIGVIPWSYIGDVRGRKPAMVAAVSLACLFALASVAMPSFELALIMRGIEGFMLGGVPALAVAYLSEEVHPRASVVAAGTFVSGTTVGGLSGRLIAAPVGEQLGWEYGILAVTALAVGCVAAFLRWAPRAQGFAPSPFRMRAAVTALTANLRVKELWIIYLQGFLLMGGFVAMYNYVGFHLAGEPFGLPLWLVSFVFLAYLAGTWSSPRAGRLAARYSRKQVLLGSSGVMFAGVALTLVPHLLAIVAGTVVFTAGFFSAHSVAAGWAGVRAVGGRAQSASLYNLGYYAGSSIFGFLGGTFLALAGWPGTVGMVLGLVAVATALAAVALPRD